MHTHSSHSTVLVKNEVNGTGLQSYIKLEEVTRIFSNFNNWMILLDFPCPAFCSILVRFPRLGTEEYIKHYLKQYFEYIETIFQGDSMQFH